MRMLLDHLWLFSGVEKNETPTFVLDACVQIVDGEIVYAGARTQAPAFVPDTRIDGAGKLAMPGLANVHTHAPMTLLRGYGSGLNLQDWLTKKIFPAEERLTPEAVAAATWLAMLEQVRYGVTAFADMYFFEETVAEAVAAFGMRASLCRSVVESSDGDDSRMREGIALVEHWHGAANGRIRCLMSPHAEYTTSPALIQRLIAQADRLGVGIHTHVSETQAEVAGCRARHGVSPVQYFAQLGLFDRPCIAAHCVVTDAADIRILAEKGVHVVHNPVSNLKLGSGVMPLPQMLSAGVQVCLGTDGVSSNNTLNLWEELRLTALLHKGVTNDPLAVSEAETLSMATRVGAQAMGFEKVGLLRKGFRADIILIDTTAPHWTPCLDPMANLVYATQGADVSLTMVDGRVLYQEGQYPGVDVQAIRQAVQREAVRMTQGI